MHLGFLTCLFHDFHQSKSHMSLNIKSIWNSASDYWLWKYFILYPLKKGICLKMDFSKLTLSKHFEGERSTSYPIR